MSQEKVKLYYNQLARKYDQDRFENSYGQFIHDQEEFLLRKYISGQEGRTLDLGCGTGRFMDYATDGLDFSKNMLEVAQQKYPEKQFCQSSATSLPFEANTFNTVFSWHVMMHLPLSDLRSILSEVNRVLMPGGLFLFDLPSNARRKMIKYKSEGWHGNTSISILELEKWTTLDWEWLDYEGIMLFPIHRLPKKMRAAVMKIDRVLNQTSLKKWASYQMFVLRKKTES